MLLDASVARSVAVLGWVSHLEQALDGELYIAHGVLAEPDEQSELRRIRDALRREADMSTPGSGRQSKAVAAALDIGRLLGPPPRISLKYPDADETRTAARLISPHPEQREWRRNLGLRARRLDAGEAVSIAIAQARGLDFASDDGQALIAYTALTRRQAMRTLDVIQLLVSKGLIEESVARNGYRLLREDDLHLLGGPDW
jgi:hypothetical protein